MPRTGSSCRRASRQSLVLHLAARSKSWAIGPVSGCHSTILAPSGIGATCTLTKLLSPPAHACRQVQSSRRRLSGLIEGAAGNDISGPPRRGRPAVLSQRQVSFRSSWHDVEFECSWIKLRAENRHVLVRRPGNDLQNHALKSLVGALAEDYLPNCFWWEIEQRDHVTGSALDRPDCPADPTCNTPLLLVCPIATLRVPDELRRYVIHGRGIRAVRGEYYLRWLAGSTVQAT